MAAVIAPTTLVILEARVNKEKTGGDHGHPSILILMNLGQSMVPFWLVDSFHRDVSPRVTSG